MTFLPKQDKSINGASDNLSMLLNLCELCTLSGFFLLLSPVVFSSPEQKAQGEIL